MNRSLQALSTSWLDNIDLIFMTKFFLAVSRRSLLVEAAAAAAAVVVVLRYAY